MGRDDDDRRRLSMTPPPYPIEDWETVWQSIVKMSGSVNKIARIVEDIPDIKTDARGAHEQAHEARIEATRASTLAEALDTRVGRLEELATQPHPCIQGQTVSAIEALAKDQNVRLLAMASDSAAERERLSNLTDDIDKAHQRISQASARRRELVMWAMGILIALLGTAAGAIWYVAQMAKTLEMESNQRQRDQVQIIQRLEQMSPRATPPRSGLLAPRAHPESKQ